MNIIFMDIDGVLNNLGSVVALGSFNHFDAVSVGLMDKLAERGNAKIVVSSAWRTGDLDLTKHQIAHAGGEALNRHIISETVWLDPPNVRGHEIANWVQENNVWAYVIIDDNSDMLLGQPLVQTTFEDGFRFSHYIKALQILNPDHVDVRLRTQWCRE